MNSGMMTVGKTTRKTKPIRQMPSPMIRTTPAHDDDDVQVGDMVLIRPIYNGEPEAGEQAVVIGFHESGNHLIYVSSQTETVGYGRTCRVESLTPSRVDGFVWEINADEYDRRRALKLLRASLGWNPVKVR